MSNILPTINPNEDLILKVERRFGCDNDFKTSIILSESQTFQRTEAIVYQETLDALTTEQQKQWGVAAQIFELKKGKFVPTLDEPFIQPLDTFATGGNYFPLFQKRIITGTFAKFDIYLSKLSAEGGTLESSLKEKKDLFGKLHPITIKCAIW